jgi:nucleotide-binding universal stress UspA family protein
VPASLSEDVLEHAVATAAQHIDADRIGAVLGYGDPARVLSQVSKDARLLSIGTHGYFAHGASLFEPLSMRIISGASCPVVVHPVLAGPSGPFAGQVVVGVDGSPAARSALAFALGHAAAHGLALAAVHITPSQGTWVTNPLLDEPQPTADDMLASELEAHSADYPGVQITPAGFTGRAVPGLLRAAAGAELLVIGARGAGSGNRGLLGSVAQQMIGNATCPVAVIPGPAQR